MISSWPQPIPGSLDPWSKHQVLGPRNWFSGSYRELKSKIFFHYVWSSSGGIIGSSWSRHWYNGYLHRPSLFLGCKLGLDYPFMLGANAHHPKDPEFSSLLSISPFCLWCERREKVVLIYDSGTQRGLLHTFFWTSTHVSVNRDLEQFLRSLHLKWFRYDLPFWGDQSDY